MHRRSLLGLVVTLIALPQPVVTEAETEEPVETRFLTDETKKWLETLYVNLENKITDSDWLEILSRFASVQLGHPLSDEARKRTFARANSKRSDKHLLFDQGPAKRAMCALISRMDDKLRI